MAQFIMKVLDSSFTATRTVTDTTAHATGVSPAIRIAVDSSGNARLVAYSAHNPPSSEGSPVSTEEQRFSIATVYSCGTSDTTFTKLGSLVSAKEGSVPFYNSTTGRFYCNFVAFRAGSALQNVSTATVGASSFVADITEAVSSRTPAKFRVAAVLGEYTPDAAYTHSSDTFGWFSSNHSPAQKPATSGYTTLLGYGQVNLYGMRLYNLGLLTLYDQKSTSFAVDAYSGGVVGRYGGSNPSECGYVQSPVVYAVDNKAGSLAAGTYVYVAIWTRRDKDGRVHFSRCSEPVSVVQSGGSGKIKVMVSVPGATSAPGDDTVMLFRTTAGGTQYYLVESKLVNTFASGSYTGIATESTLTFSDQLADATLSAMALLYRAPGTANTSLDRCNPVSGSHVVRHKDRVFYAHNNSVFYSSFDVDGEAPWFSPGLTFDVLNGTGPIVGLASMEGSLIVFKRDAVFVVNGDGPPENGGSGAEFTPPTRVHTEYGCIDPRSIVSTPDGIVYRSSLGIMMLTRGFKVVWIGERVQSTVDANAYTGGCTFDRSTGRIYIPLSNTLTSDGGLSSAASGVTLVFDTINNVWSRFLYTNNTGGPGWAMQDVCYANSSSPAGGTDCVFLADHGAGFFYESASSSLDAAGTFVSWKLATGWIRAASKQDRIHISDLQFLGRQVSGHNLNCTYYTNYNRSTSTDIGTFDATATAITPEQLEFQPTKRLVQSMKFVVSSVAPSNPTTLGSGQQVVINGITVRIGVKGGGPKLATTQKE